MTTSTPPKRRRFFTFWRVLFLLFILGIVGVGYTLYNGYTIPLPDGRSLALPAQFTKQGTASAAPSPTTTPTGTTTPAPPTPAQPPAFSRTITRDNYAFELTECRQVGNEVICEFQITHKESDVDFYINRQARLIAVSGYEYGSSDMRIANVTGFRQPKTLTRNTPNAGSITFGEITQPIDLISLIELPCIGGGQDFMLELRNIKVKR